jgi:hypothetical protein
MPVSARHGWLTRFACAMVLPAWCLAVPGVVDYKFGAECQWLRELTKQDCIGVQGELQPGFWVLGTCALVHMACFLASQYV